MRLPLIRSIFALALFALSGVRADAQTIYVVGTGNQFGSINFSTGAYTQISASLGTGYQGLAYSSSGGVFYSVSSANNLSTITTGGTVTAGPSTAATVRGVALNSSGTLFGHNTASNNLVTINTTSGAQTTVGATGVAASTTTPAGLTFVGSTLYAGVKTTNSTNGLYSFNTGGGTGTLLGDGGNPALYDTLVTFSNGSNLYGIALDSGALKLFGVNPSNGNYFYITNVTGANLPTGFTGASFVPVPEPGSVLAIGAAGAGVVGWLRRRRAA